MRIGLVIYGSLKTLSGGYLYDRKLVEYLQAQGDEVEILSLPWRSYPRHLLDNLSSPWLDRLAQARLDVLLQDELNHPSLFRLNRSLRPRVAYPILSIVHHLRCQEQSTPPMRLLYRVVEWRYLASVDGFIFNSRATRRSVEGLLQGPREGVVAHPGGNRLGPALDEEAIRIRAQRRGPLRLVFIGNLIPRKGLGGLLTALAALRDEPWELAVVGSREVDPGYAAAMQRRIATLGLEARVQLVGPRSDAELAHRLRESDLLAMPFAYEGFGIVYLEAAAYGLPALASSAGGAHEIVSHDETGYLLEPGDIPRLAGILRHLIADRSTLLRLSLAARRRFAEFPTWEQTASRIRSFLSMVVPHASQTQGHRILVPPQ
ncbi:MAG: glycosyltransferase family 4 protein [Candidatus Tectomicrobia bacterium]|uniref:Glycosyltransferase family 4 protein n=1 Tax=Tectimicrobiota bacterium TaxID=2528274 RepID=A0A932CLJ0_UNCTE|nr:glycosyltransferase family 4 protein [Candidatus Tectomicrobia bacterium]